MVDLYKEVGYTQLIKHKYFGTIRILCTNAMAESQSARV